jgi:hypothetical protein
MKKSILLLMLVIAGISSCTYDKGEVPEPAVPINSCDLVSFSNDIYPLISANCIGCHNASFTANDLSNYAGVKAKVDNGSFRLRVLVIRDMPGYCTLPDSSIQQIECWLSSGAKNN